MFDIGWTELLLIGIVALIVVGPKDLPVMFRTLGRFTAKLRAMGREFSRAMEQAADESGVKDIARDVRAATNLRQAGIDVLKDAATKFESWDPRRTGPTAATQGQARETSAARAAGAATAAAASAAPPAAPGAAGPAGGAAGAAAATAKSGTHTQAAAAAQAARKEAALAAARTAAAPDAARAAPPADRSPEA